MMLCAPIPPDELWAMRNAGEFEEWDSVSGQDGPSCERCAGTGRMWARRTCCTGSANRIECACGGQQVIEPTVSCPDCRGSGVDPECEDGEW